jgi:hypothetical protein
MLAHRGAASGCSTERIDWTIELCADRNPLNSGLLGGYGAGAFLALAF